MKEGSKPVEKPESIQPINDEIRGEQLERIAGGFNPQPDPPGMHKVA